jgi:uncharacterized membrane protein YdjX (TVP38/TMEM64 family)
MPEARPQSEPGFVRTWWTKARSLDPRVQLSGVLAIAWSTVPGLISIYVLLNLKWCAQWLQSWGDLGPLVGGVLFAATAGVGLIPSYAQSIVMGWAFGLPIGLAVAMFGCVAGAALGYGISRAITRDRIETLIDRKPQWAVVRRSLAEAGFFRTAGIVALLRFSPSSPFAFTNLALAGCGVGWLPMLIGTTLGMLPRTAIAVWAASLAASDDPSVMQFFETPMAKVIGAAIVVGVLVLLHHIGKRALQAAGLAAPPARGPAEVG